MHSVVKVTIMRAVESFKAMTTPVLATLFASLLAYTGSSGEAFILWVCISTLDMIFGVVVSIVHSSFCAKKLYNWVFKIFIQLLTIVVFAAVLRMFAIASGVNVFIASWLLLFFGLMDVSSILDKFLQLGYLPKPASILLGFLRRRSSKVFAAMVNDPRLEREMREALGEKDKKLTIKNESCKEGIKEG